MDVLYIALGDTDPQSAVRWWVCEDSDISASGTGSLIDVESEASERAKDSARLDTVVLLPDREILYIEVEIPGRSQARVRQAAPFAVEPHLTEEIDDVHIALGDVKQRGLVPCMVINKLRFEEYLSVLEEAAIQPSVVTTPGMLFDASDSLYLIELGSGVTIRTPDQLAVVSEDVLVPTLLTTVSAVDGGAKVTCVGNETLLTTTRKAISQLDDDDIEINLVSFESLLTGVGEPSDLLNLQQGSYATRDSGVMIRQMLNKTAVLAGVCVVIVSVIFVAQGIWADLQADKLRDEALDIYEAVYNTRDVSGNPVFRMQERLGARVNEQSKWLSLLESVVGATADVEIQNLDFNESQNKMGIQFFADSYQEFEAIRARIENLGMNVEVNVAEQQANRVWARVTLSTP
ncbi:MAG: type II secretion system protein GspL [Gammaproteobacteria bacterium]|nr:type II secretion system protein GspL [Gammaproteobacteria bacterium]